MSNYKFKEGDDVFLYYNKKNSWITKIENKEFFTNYGKLQLLDLVGLSYGDKVKTNKNQVYTVLPPTAVDWIRNLKHKSQIIYEKDAGAILIMLNAQPGQTIIEAGTGSGALTSILARIVGPKGKIITHDIREKALTGAKQNLDRMGITNVIFNLKDIRDGFANEKCHSIFLDMVDPWEVIPHTKYNLIPGGKLVIFQPTFNQLEKCFVAMRETGYIDLRAVEFLEREIEIKSNAVRPSTRMIGHSGFLLEGRFLGL